MKWLGAVILIALVPLGANALSIPSTSGIEISANPEHPRPSERVTITANPIGVSANTAVFDWVVDGVRVAQETGAKSITVTAPTLGNALEISVYITVDGFSAGSETFELRSATVALVWEAGTSRVPFYIGRPEPNGHSTITAVAVPNLVRSNGTLVDKRDVVYEWMVDGNPVPSSSGVGRSTIRAETPFYDTPFSLSVIASTQDGTISAKEQTVVVPRTPELVLYKDTPLGGIETERAIGDTLNFDEEEVVVNAYPLGVNAINALAPEWTLDGTPFTIESLSPWTAVFRKTSEGSGRYTVGISYSHVRNFLERASHSFLLTF